MEREEQEVRALRERLAGADAFDAASLEKLLGMFVQDEGIQIGQIIHALRVAVTGKAIGFGVFDAKAPQYGGGLTQPNSIDARSTNQPSAQTPDDNTKAP